MKLLITVSVSGLSGERNAYTSVLSAEGSSEISGASRWLEAEAVPGPELRMTAATRASVTSAAAPRATATLRMRDVLLCGWPRRQLPAGVNARHSPGARDRFTRVATRPGLRARARRRT